MPPDLISAVAPVAGIGLTLAIMSGPMAVRHERAQVENGKKVLAYGLGIKTISAISLAMK
jgi:hypothetical protein